MEEKKKVYEVRSNYYDEELGAWAIDCWFDADENSEGEVVAHVFDDGSISWDNALYKENKVVKEEIISLINEIIRPAMVRKLELIDKKLDELKKDVKNED